MKYYLGLDGGGTHTRFLIINQQGQILGQHKDETIHIHQVGTEKTKERFFSSINKVCNLANIEAKDISNAFLGFGGYGEVVADSVFIDNMVKEILPRFTCGNDVHVAWAGSLAANAGVHIVAGTGSIVYARNEKNEDSRCGGWGHFFGDEGSAFWIGQMALNIFSRQSDGRLPKSHLLELLRNQYNLQRDFEMISIYQEEFLGNRTKIASIAPILFEAARLGDSSALDCVRLCAKEQAITIYGASKQLQWESKTIPVSYSGGIFEAGDILLNNLSEELQKLDPSLILQNPILSPILGAVYYASVLDKGEGDNYLLKQLKNTQIHI